MVSIDSHIGPSEQGDLPPSYSDVMRDVTAEGTDMDRLERKNSKTLKQKSKSDPSGEKHRDSIDLPGVLAAAAASQGGGTQSTPMLSDESKDRVSQLPEFSATHRERHISKSDTVLSSPERELRPVRVEQLKELEAHVVSSDSSEDGVGVAPRQQQPRRPSKKRRQGVSGVTEGRDRVMASATTTAAAAAAGAGAVAMATGSKGSASGHHHHHKGVSSGSEESIKISKSTSALPATAAAAPTTPRTGHHLLLQHAATSTAKTPPPSKPHRGKKDSSNSEPSTPLQVTTSPESTLERPSPDEGEPLRGGGHGGLMLPPTHNKKTSLTRSHSSASVHLHKVESLQGGTHTLPASARPKELHAPVRKSRTSFLDHLGSSSGQPRNRTWSSYHTPLEPIVSQSSLSLFDGADKDKEKRDLIVQEFFSTEQQYVEALQMLVEKYMIPMKTQGILDSNMVDDIFYKINEIYVHHAMLLNFLHKSLKDWDTQTSTIGGTIYGIFSKQTVIESYMSFIENFPRAEKTLDEISTKSSFQKFIEQCEREIKTKLPLKAQIVKPAQRIPRYELLLKRMLDYTPKDHPDYSQLIKAEKAIHDLALKINKTKEGKQEEDLQETLKKLELLLITDLIVPDRIYCRHDMVQIYNRKDPCCIWLFSDLAVFSSIKRKSGPVNRKATLLLQSPSGNDFVENIKHKMWLKISLEDLEIIQSGSFPQRKQLVDKETLEEDFSVLSQISALTAKLQCENRLTLETTVQEMLGTVNKQLSEHQLKSPPPEANKVELIATTTECLEHMIIVFPSPDKRASWESTFIEAKQKLVQATAERPPEFQQSLPITKTRAGMQFSCASPIDGLNTGSSRDVWVCNSDGYVGHMCLLSLQPEPIVTLNTPVPGCNSRILCICAVPAFQGCIRKGSGRRHGYGHQPPRIHVEAHQDAEREREAGYMSDTSSTDSELEDPDTTDLESEKGSSLDRGRSPRSGFKSQNRDSRNNKDISPGPERKDSVTLEPSKCTMWLGTEDGCLLIFPTTENMRTTKNKVKIQQNAGVLSIVHLDQKVFISLGNGDLIVYRRGKDGAWATNCPDTVNVSSAAAPVSKMLAVAGKLWCACKHEIAVVSPASIQVELTFVTQSDAKKGIQCMATSGLGVWIASLGSSKVQLFHATTLRPLLEVSIAQAVAQKLQTADDIIRQHKTACLRITSLVTCKDLLWVGTSAGVILTLPIPKVTQTTTKHNVTMPTVTGLVHGHTGHVRFLTCVDVTPPPRSTMLNDESAQAGELASLSWRSRRMSLGIHTFTLATKMLVISGGDGYEDFRTSGPSESTGRDDSTNHLILWSV